MKVVLFCGGLGMRMREFSEALPKPMVPVGPRPVLWHLMRYYAHYGHKDFILCLGHQGDKIKEYFLNYKEWVSNDFTLSAGGHRIELLNSDIDDWRITFVDTGLRTNIGQRLMAVRNHLAGEEAFLANYADGLTDARLPDVIEHFHQGDKVGTFLCVRPRQTFHVVSLDPQGQVEAIEDSTRAGVWVNGGFFVFKQEIFDYIEPGEELVYEPFERLIKLGELAAYRHEGFWVGMDTFKDRQELDEMCNEGQAAWQVWRSADADV